MCSPAVHLLVWGLLCVYTVHRRFWMGSKDWVSLNLPARYPTLMLTPCPLALRSSVLPGHFPIIHHLHTYLTDVFTSMASLHTHTHSPLPLPSLFWTPDWPESQDMHVPIFPLYISSSYTPILLIWPLSDIPASYIVHMQFKLTLIAWCTQVNLSVSWICMFISHIGLRYYNIYYKVSTSPRWTALA